MNILKLFNDQKIDKYVIGDEVPIEISDIECKRISDVRSAAFYAFGESKIKNETVVLIINGEFLTNIYTVFTEAWFQKTDLIVLAVYNSIYDIETHYLNRCLVTNMKFMDKDIDLFENDILDSLNKIGPKLYNVVKTNDNNCENDYEKILDILDFKLRKETEVHVFNSKNNKHYKFLNILNIPIKYKYGVISKYCAKTLTKENSILICNDEVVKSDFNIFLSKYLTKNFKVIIKFSEDFNFIKGLKNRNISIIESEKLENDIEKFIDDERPCVLLYKEA